MNTLIFLGLAAAVMLTTAGSVLPSRAQPPQIIYVQTAPTEPSETGSPPLLILVGVVLAAITLL